MLEEGQRMVWVFVPEDWTCGPVLFLRVPCLLAVLCVGDVCIYTLTDPVSHLLACYLLGPPAQSDYHS